MFSPNFPIRSSVVFWPPSLSSIAWPLEGESCQVGRGHPVPWPPVTFVLFFFSNWHPPKKKGGEIFGGSKRSCIKWSI